MDEEVDHNQQTDKSSHSPHLLHCRSCWNAMKPWAMKEPRKLPHGNKLKVAKVRKINDKTPSEIDGRDGGAERQVWTGRSLTKCDLLEICGGWKCPDDQTVLKVLLEASAPPVHHEWTSLKRIKTTLYDYKTRCDSALSVQNKRKLEAWARRLQHYDHSWGVGRTF